MFSKPNLKPYGRITEWRSGLALIDFSARVISSPALCRSEPGECLRIWSMLFNQNFQFQISTFLSCLGEMGKSGRERGFALPDAISVRSARHWPASARKAKAELSVQTILARHPLIETFSLIFFTRTYIRGCIPVPGRTDKK